MEGYEIIIVLVTIIGSVLYLRDQDAQRRAGNKPDGKWTDYYTKADRP